MNVMKRFTLRSLKANKKWTVVTLIGIILSTAMLSAVSTFCASFMELLRNEAIAENGNWHAMVSDVKIRDVPVFEEVEWMDKIALIRDVGYAPLENSKNKNKPYLFIRQFSEDACQNFPFTLIEGRMPQKEDELLLSQHLQTNGGITYQVGDQITVKIGKRISLLGRSLGQSTIYQSPDFSDGESFLFEQERRYTVVGMIKRPSFEPTIAPGYTAISFLDPDTLGPDEKITVTLLSKKLKHRFYSDVFSLAERIGMGSDQIVFNNDLLHCSGVFAGNSTQNVIYGFALVFVLIIMIASVSLIYNAFSISVSERVSQLGMLASVGATKQQKRQSVYFEGFLLGVTGIPVGIISGISGIGVTLSAIRPLMESMMDFSSDVGLSLYVSFPSIAAAFVLAALTIFISVWIPARRASKLMPIDAIRQSEEIKLTRKSVKTSWITRALFGFEGEIALKNLKHNRKKYRATVFSLIISLVLFLTVSYYAKVINLTSDFVA